MKTVLLALLVLPVLAGCATQAQRQYEQNIHNYNAALTSWENCKKPILEFPVAHRLNKILIMDFDDPRTVEKLALKRYVTEQEAKDIIDYLARMRPCRKLSIEGFSKVHPEYVATLARLYSEADADAAKVINHELTIGVANQRLVDRGNQVRVEFSQIGQRITSQLNQAHQYELAQRRIAQQELQKWNYQQQVLANQLRIQQQINLNQTRNRMNQTIQSLNLNRNRTTTTNCTYSGNTLNCTHY